MTASPQATLPGALSPSAFSGLLATGIFFGFALICFLAYTLWRLQRAADVATHASLAEPYHVEDMPYTISAVRSSIAKPPAYFPSPWTEDAESQKLAITMAELKSPPLPGYSIPELMAQELRDSIAADSTYWTTAATAGTPTTPTVPSIIVTSSPAGHARLPSIPPPIPIPTRDAQQHPFSRYTMPPPTPTCPVTGMPLELSYRTPPPVYDSSMERAQREVLRQQRPSRSQKRRWRDTLKSVKSIVAIAA